MKHCKRVVSLLLVVLTLITMIPSVALASASTAKVYNWKQTDAQWKKNYSGISWPKSCAVTAIAIQIARTDLVRVNTKSTKLDTATMTGFNPGSFARAWRGKGGLTQGASVTWSSVGKVIPGFVHKTKSPSNGAFSYYKAATKAQLAKSMKSYLDAGYYPIVEGPGSGYASNKGSRHYVAVIEVKGNDVIVVDPADGKKKSIYDVQCGGEKTRWTLGRLDYCGKGTDDDYACCVLYKVNTSKLLKENTTTTPAPAAKITTSGLTSPSTINYGDKFAFKGKITSNYKLSSVVGGIYNASTGKKVQEYTFKLNATTFDIAKNLGSKLNTAKLAAGKYKYRIYCTDAETKTCKTVVDKTFTVKKATASIKVSGLTVPDAKIIQGSKFYFKGNITSTYKLKTVVGGIYSSTGKKVQVYTYSPNKTSLNIYDTFDRKIRMGNLAPGKYVYKIVCTDAEGYTKTIVNEEFTVLKAGTITVKSATLPKNIKCGSKFYFKGTISSTYKIKKAYGGLYTTSGKKVQYFSYSPNSTKLDIYKTFDRDLRMAKLSKGNYVYKIVCEDIYGTSKTVINHKFVVK